MKLKSYFSGTVEAAIELAHKELGEDALLVNVRQAALETRHLGAYEVVFGVTAAPGESAAIKASAAQPGAGVPSDRTPAERVAPERMADDLAELRRQIARMSDALRGSRGFAAAFAPGSSAARSEASARLVEAELDPELANLVAQGTPLEDFCSADATLGRAGAARAVVALVGPPGAGKTTTLVKLAVRYGLAGRRRAHFLTADVFRVAAAEQLRTLAAILGVGCDVVETPAALEQALEEHRLKDLVLIDTPGLGWADLEDGRDFARTLAAHPEADIHLVLPASMKASDLARMADQFAMFRPAKLIFTRLDETARFGALISEAVRSRLPISFLATGQEIPDALEPATRERLAALIEEGGPDFFAHPPGKPPRLARDRSGGMKQATQQEPISSSAAAPSGGNPYQEYHTIPPSAEERERLILEHLPQVRLIARRIHDRLPESVSLEDLISTGVVGLISAIDRFDAAHNVKLKTYAEYKIRGAILDSLRGLDWAPRQQRKRSKQIEAAIASAEQRLHRTPSEDEIAAELQLSVEEYHEWLIEVRGLNLGSLESAISPDQDNPRDLLRYVSSDEQDWPSHLLERSELERLLAESISKMPDIEKTVLSLYYYQEMTLREISKIVGLHESRISQLKSQAILRLRSYMVKRWPGPRGT